MSPIVPVALLVVGVVLLVAISEWVQRRRMTNGVAVTRHSPSITGGLLPFSAGDAVSLQEPPLLLDRWVLASVWTPTWGQRILLGSPIPLPPQHVSP